MTGRQDGELRFRRAELADCPAIVALVESAYRGASSRKGWTTEADLLDGQRTDATLVLAAIDDASTTVILAEDAGALVGCCEVRVDGAVAHFGMFAVRPAHQGGGAGRALLAAAESHARMAGATTMELLVIEQRDELIAWYLRRGFKATGATAPFPYGDERFGIPKRPDLRFIVLAKELPGISCRLN